MELYPPELTGPDPNPYAEQWTPDDWTPLERSDYWQPTDPDPADAFVLVLAVVFVGVVAVVVAPLALLWRLFATVGARFGVGPDAPGGPVQVGPGPVPGDAPR